MPPFSTISHLPSHLLTQINHLGFREMTPIQSQAIPPILQGCNLLAQSKTGSGKSLAFLIPTLMHPKRDNHQPHTLILTPTRELADQLAFMARSLGSQEKNLKIITLYGGLSLRDQANSLQRGADIIIATTGRIRDHLGKETLCLEGVERLILDEADRMLQMGFYEDILAINERIIDKKQTLLFSATFPKEVATLAQHLLIDPITIKIDHQEEPTSIKEGLYESHDKLESLQSLLAHRQPSCTLIFANTKRQVIELAQRLSSLGHHLTTLHGDLDQIQREEALLCFANGSKPLLIATDIASRGIDIEAIDLIINYQLPISHEIYTHRIGRTGRMGKQGEAISLLSHHEYQKSYLKELLPLEKVPSYQSTHYTITSPYQTLCLLGGKKDKVSAGDIVGVLCQKMGVAREHIGKITIKRERSYVALHQKSLPRVTREKRIKIKKRALKVWVVD
jgi:ATP-independent RNA helicase DbpA